MRASSWPLVLALLILSLTAINAQPISPIVATNLANSANANVLVDGAYALSSSTTWAHTGNQWQPSGYPWMASLDMAQPHALSELKYYSGPIPYPATAKLTIEASNNGQTFVQLATAVSPSYGNWNSVVLSGQYRFLRLRFNAVNQHFKITEIRVFGSPTGPITSTPTPSPSEPGTVTPFPTWNSNVNLQTAVPPSSQQFADYLEWPKNHLSLDCRILHDRYWTRGPNADPTLDPATRPNDPEYFSYHTWHPAIATVGDLTCDYGHEHGHDPTRAGDDMFQLFGGWPAFGYAAAKNNNNQRKEDHVGHKVTVAKFGAALGDGANTGSQLYDAGFECSWLSKIHQGSWSMDAFKNHLHEYFLALSCNDGPNGDTGTRLSIKFLYTFGKANEFNPKPCNPNPQSPAQLEDPNGNIIGSTTETNPDPNDSVNGREFTCYNKLGWHPPEDQQQVDLWTQPIRIERGSEKPVFLQPYYIVKNPARILKDSTTVKYTVDLCQDPSTSKSGFCDAVTPSSGTWNSAGTPFNGALRALNFKKVSLYNDNQPTNWCTDAFGRGGNGSPPCGINEIEQYAKAFTNGWDWKTVNGKSDEVKGAWWTRDVCGNLRTAEVMNDGYKAFGLGFEYVVDNRDPDDDCDNIPDGATLRGVN